MSFYGIVSTPITPTPSPEMLREKEIKKMRFIRQHPRMWYHLRRGKNGRSLRRSY